MQLMPNLWLMSYMLLMLMHAILLIKFYFKLCSIKKVMYYKIHKTNW